MKAVVYNGPRDIAVKTVADARIEQPTEVLVKITTTNICGSDLHTYAGRTRAEPGTVLGHENPGEVIDIGDGADKGCECVGYQAHDPDGDEHPDMTMNNLVKSVRATGRIAIDWGTFWSKGMSVGTGQTPVKAYNRRLRDLIHAGRATPSWIVSHTLPLEDAPDAYKHFDARDKGWTKVVLKPAGDGASLRAH
jgi:threonine dehydrogenase-like Zn-dependent dehydrogenase